MTLNEVEIVYEVRQRTTGDPVEAEHHFRKEVALQFGGLCQINRVSVKTLTPKQVKKRGSAFQWFKRVPISE